MAAVGERVSLWEACLTLREDEDSDNEDAAVTLRASGATEDAAKAALADVLHQRVFDQPIASNAEENFNDYDSQLSFFESIRAQHQSKDRPESYAAILLWAALYDALETMRTVKLQ